MRLVDSQQTAGDAFACEVKGNCLLNVGGPSLEPQRHMSPKIPRGGPEHREIKQEGSKGNSFSNIPNTEFISQGGKEGHQRERTRNVGLERWYKSADIK